MLLAKLRARIEDQKGKNRIADLYPETGPLRRELYAKHMAFFKAGATYRQRLFLAANRVGKTQSALTEIVYHATGNYPAWWEGKRFVHPQNWYVCGKDSNTVKVILQQTLLGPVQEFGTGLIPAASLDFSTLKDAKKADTPVSQIRVKHKGGAYSSLIFKSYDSGRKSFEGVACCVLLDEEPPMSVYVECLMRTMTGDNILMATFTPLMGISDVVLAFLGSGDLSQVPEEGLVSQAESKFTIQCGWDDAPHLSEQAKTELLASIPPFQRDARSKGIPQLGAGAIYPVPESEIKVDPFEIPKSWPKLFALDVGWNKTAAIWLSRNPDTGLVYAFSEYYKGQAEPTIHAQGIKARGAWIPGVIDPASRGRSQTDGSQLIQMYGDLGLKLTPADNSVETGLYTVWEALSTGRLKIFSNLQNFFAEYRLYRRDEKGHVVKSGDHLCDCLRYAMMSLDQAKTEAAATPTAYSPGVVSQQYKVQPTIRR